MLRKKLYNLVYNDNPRLVYRLYNYLMFLTIIVSIIPLLFIENQKIFSYTEKFALGLFLFDYIVRWITADYKFKKGWVSFLIYPFTPMAIIDILSILPCINIIGDTFKIFRLTRFLSVFRFLKLLRYSSKVTLLFRVFKKERNVLISVLVIAIFYIFLTAMIIFNIEPHINPITGRASFENIFDALYWATVTLTTVGYGDLCPVTEIGRFISMVSSIFGVAIIALPSGVITASYLDELRNEQEKKKDEKKQ